jgi:integrase
MYSDRFPEFLFPVAARKWLESRRGRVAVKTFADCESYIQSLAVLFGQMKLSEIRVGHLVVYQRSRQAAIRGSAQHKAARAKVGGSKRSASDGASRINHELSMLGRILTHAGLWEAIKKHYEPLPMPKEGPGIALTDDEERYLFKLAGSRTKWLVAYHCAMLTRNTTAGPGEVLHLWLADVDVSARTIAIRYTEEHGKNPFRERTLPLNGDALASVQWLLDRARRAGANSPDHFLVPARGERRGDLWDPTRPMGSYRKAWESLRAEAGKKFPRLLTVRPYDLRHTACTRLMENGAVSEATIEKIMGHRLGSRTNSDMPTSATRVCAPPRPRSMPAWPRYSMGTRPQGCAAT